MDKLFNYFRLFSLSTSGVLLLCIVFAINPELAHGIITGKVCWFHFSAMIFAISIIFMEFTIRKSHYIFSLPDTLLLLTFGFVLFTYNREENLQPERFIFIAQLTVLWFMLRAAIQRHHELRIFYITIVMLVGIITAFWGIHSPYNIAETASPVFKLLKDAISPEPFAGYIAIILPICLNMVLRFKNCNKSAWWETRTFLYYFSCMGVLVISIALLIKINKPALFAAIISCAWVGWMRLIGWEKTREMVIRHNRLFSVSSIILIFFLAGLAMMISIHKAENGNRQLLIWNVTTKAIMEHPISGTGLGGFPTAYARTQATYLSSGLATENEKLNAICPDHAYNEYLQIGLEFGIGGLLIFILWLAFTLFYGIKHRQIGSSGGIVSLAIFAMYSYPLQIPSFWILLIFLSVICVTDPIQPPRPNQRNIPYVGLLAAIVSCFIFLEQKNNFHVYKEWNTLKELHVKHKYKYAVPQYTNLYPELQHQVDFLLEGAVCLRKTGEYDTAIQWLKHALKISSNPDIYYEIARNEKALGRFDAAEYYLQDISYILPENGYTYYLLTQLYSEPAFFRHEKLTIAANKVLSLAHSHHGGVTEEMKNNIYKILQDTAK